MDKLDGPVVECLEVDPEWYALPEWELDRSAVASNGYRPDTEDDESDSKLEVETAKQFRRLLALERARELMRVRRRGELDVPEPRWLADLLAEPDQPVRWRVERWWPGEGRLMLAAAAKTGKTTLVGNLVRSLVDGVPFLGCYPVERVTGSVVVIDNEMSVSMLRRLYGDLDIANLDRRVAVYPLRGYGSAFDITDAEVRAEWAGRLRKLDAEVIVLDCLNPALVALGLKESSNDDTGQFLAAFDELLREAGVEDALIVHHMGHQGERARGASKLLGWPEVNWKLVRDREDEDGPELDDGTRYVSAYGRENVDVPEAALEYDTATRRLTLLGGNRRQRGVNRNAELVAEIVREATEADGPYSIIAKDIKTRLALTGVGNATAQFAAIECAESAKLIHHRSRGNSKEYAPGPKPPDSGPE